LSENTIYGLGDKLKQLREKHNLTQKEVAARLNVDRNTVNRYESNEITPPVEKLVKLAIMYNISLDYLVGIGKEYYLSLHGFNEKQRDVIIQLVNVLKENFPNNDN